MQKIQEEKAVKISQFQKQAGAIAKDVIMHNKRLPIEINGMKLLALVTYKDLERLMELDRENQEFYSAMDKIGEAFKDVPQEEIDRELDRIRKDLREKKQ